MTKPRKIGLAKATSWTMLGFGVASLFASIVYTSSILAFAGLGLVFWGAILIYIQPQEYTRKVLLDASLLPSLATLNQIMQELDYKGKPIYLPPKYLKDPETSKAYISKQKDGELPTPGLTLEQENRLFIKDPQGMLLTPPGAELTKLLEKTIGTSFTKVDLEYLIQNLPKLFIEDLEIAENLEIRTTGDTIQVKITNSIYKDACEEVEKLSNIHGKIGCPLFSAIACALTKATGKPITIEKIEASEDGKNIEATFRALEKTEPQERAEAAETATLHTNHLPNLVSLFLAAFGSIILAWVGWLTWYDITTWGKDIPLIFFGSRTGEAISLGIGMKVIYYFLIGLASLLMGLLMFLRRRRSKL